MKELVDVTQLTCPDNPHGGTHHLQPRGAGAGLQQMVCRDCRRTEKQLRAAQSGKEGPRP